MNSNVLIVTLMTVGFTACAQVALKYAVMDIPKSSDLFQSWQSLFSVLFSGPTIAGLVMYALSILSWLWVLSKVDLSVAYPFVGISFVFTMIFGAFLFGESVTTTRVVGTLLIVVGVSLVARTA